MKKRLILAACMLLAVTPCAACGGESSGKTVGKPYRDRLKQSDCNDIARRMAVAASSALIDFSADGLDLSVLGSGQNVSYSEFCDAAAEDKVPDKQLFASMKYYDSDLEQSDFVRVSLKIENGVCTAAAVSFRSGDALMYGTYPRQTADSASEPYADITAALNYAAS